MPSEIPLSKKLAAEFVAMTLFVWIGCGTAVSSQSIDVIKDSQGTYAAFLLTTSLAFGTAIAVLAYSIAPVSGGHINPAVTTSLLLLGEIPILDAAAYIATQFVAAILGAALVWGTMKHSIVEDVQGGNPPFLVGVNTVDSGISIGAAFLLEFLGTFLLVWTVCMTAVSKSSIAANIAPIAIGWSVFLAHLCLIPFTGCGINPARVLGPMILIFSQGDALPADGFTGWWIYYTAPFVGGAFAAIIYKFIFEVPEEDDSDQPDVEQAIKSKRGDTVKGLGSDSGSDEGRKRDAWSRVVNDRY
mmetsp:Transcript_20207/g.35579  ORF Transcript_20207/g.35579 Transcript_20207/m.35579 type:complete len:301 (-) Transcript_20207:146-1048(-)